MTTTSTPPSRQPAASRGRRDLRPRKPVPGVDHPHYRDDASNVATGVVLRPEGAQTTALKSKTVDMAFGLPPHPGARCCGLDVPVDAERRVPTSGRPPAGSPSVGREENLPPSTSSSKPRATPRLTPPLKWHGGKHYLAKEIVSRMPKHQHFVEAFAGGLAVLLRKNPDEVSEVANDVNPWLSNFWSVLGHEARFERFRRMAEATPVSERVWDDVAREMAAMPDVREHPPVRAALMFFVHCRQSLAGRMRAFTPLTRNRARRGMNEQASAWLTAVDGLPAVHARLKRVAIRNAPAVDVIRGEDGPDTLFYLDPPYPHETRSSPDAYGAFEMSRDDHAELLDTIKLCTGKVMISGYDNPPYRQALGDWTRHTFDQPNNAAGGEIKARKTEVLWCNF